MKRPIRDLEIFGISALDLFASAMGAFIILVLIMFSFYLKKDDFGQTVKKLEGTVEEKKKEVKEARALAIRLGGLEKIITSESDKVKKAQGKLNHLNKEIKKLRSDLEKKKKENKKLGPIAEKIKKKPKEKLSGKFKRFVDFSLLGISTRAKSFVIAVDMSGSMSSYEKIAKETMARIVEPLGEKDKIAIIGYQGSYSLHYWPPTRGTMRAADAAGKAGAIRFTNWMTRNFGSGNPAHEALKHALDYDAGAIILVSDGDPNKPAKFVLDDITRRNGGKKEIHTVAIGDYVRQKSLVAFLQELARRNSGDFVGISR